MDKTFDEAIHDVRNAERGVDVREALAQGFEYVKQYGEDLKSESDKAAQSAQTAASSATTATQKSEQAKSSADAAANSEESASSSKAAAKASETKSAENLQATKEYFEQVRTITLGAQGWYATPAALTAAVPVGENGWWAVVGTTDTIWTWDSDTRKWKDSAQSIDISEYYTRSQIDTMMQNVRKITFTDVDPGAGSTLATDTILMVYK